MELSEVEQAALQINQQAYTVYNVILWAAHVHCQTHFNLLQLSLESCV